MIDEETGEPHTYHTTQPVPLFIIGEDDRRLRPDGILADVAPTVLELMGIAQSPEMTGQSLIERRGA
jgi:2,3-bisphosphoglycerate-independent phosphoglycerate mutase